MSQFDSHKWSRKYKEAMADRLNEKDNKVTLKDLLHTIKVDDKKADKTDIKLGAENDLAIEKDKDGNDVYAGGLKEDYSTMRLKSNIDQKWGSSKDMQNDLRQWFEASMQSGGYDLIDDIVSALEVELRLYKQYRNKMRNRM